MSGVVAGHALPRWCAIYRISFLRNKIGKQSGGMEDEVGGRRPGDLAENPLLAQLVLVKMEDIMDKLKLLRYESGFCKGLKFKPLSRYNNTACAHVI